MKRLCASLLLAVPLVVVATPQFKDFPADVYTGKSKPAVISKQFIALKTRVKSASKWDANFAGHYVVDSVGCGTECAVYFYVDLKAGRVAYLPESLQPDYSDIECESEAYYKPNSRLFVASSMLSGACSVAYYEFLDGKFKLIETQPFQGVLQ